MPDFASIWQSRRLKFSENKGTNDFFERHKTIEADLGILTYNGEKTELEVLLHNADAISKEYAKKQDLLMREVIPCHL